MSQHQDVKVLLVSLQQVLEQHGHWQSVPPSDEALSSVEPFSVDTLTCTEWLQWVFIPKMRQLVDHELPLPSAFSISPYVEEALNGAHGRDAIARVTQDIDALFQTSSQ